MSKIELGCVARDTITGYSGVVIAISHYLNECTSVALKSQKLKDGLPQKDCWFDIEDLRLTKKPPKRKAVPSGGPRSHPKFQPPERH